MGFTRRDFFTLTAGAAVAVPLTPVPWKLLDDTAKWSQNWSWIPRPPRGPVTTRSSSCTLCPAGCGIQARACGGNAIGIAPVAGHPVSRGVLCPYAFGAHQLPYHPARNSSPLRRGQSVSLGAVTAELSTRLKTGMFAIYDERPGRAVSAEYQRIAAARGGTYVASRPARLPLPLEEVRTIVSFGVPVLESWATPGRVLSLWKQRQLAIVQIEPDLSKTAALADHWLPARPGSEGTVARYLGGKVALEEAVTNTGLGAERLSAALNFIRQRGPALTVSQAAQAAGFANQSFDVVIVDHGLLGGSLEYDSLRSALRPGGLLVSLSPYRAGIATRADYLIPTPAFGESLEEAPTPWDAVVSSYALAPPLIDAPAGIVRPLDFISRITGDGVTTESAIRARVESLWKSRRGEVFLFADRIIKPITDFKSAADLWKAYDTGACWTGTTDDRFLSSVDVACPSDVPAVTPPLYRRVSA